ncbi:MAG TPA: CusA/CzcA family heavy metal efflux RND transporter [Polyangia bacterium]|jgi:cobalt-zinc-cadmium resistance protein CzcA|nr:CusA/CzcA family heavy metal efflux RND transporter [Polyangia bacterium]
MLDRLIDFAVHRRAFTLIATLAFIIFGVVTFTKLKIEAFPDVTNVQVMVIALYPGQAAEEVEKQVTIPVERALTGTPRVLIQRSITSFGLSQVILTFEDDVDIYWARQQVAERLPDADVPPGIQPHLGPNDTPVGQVFQYTLESDHHTPSELRSWQDWVVSKQLMRAPGVADVVSFGGFQKEYHVLADPSLLRNNGLSLRELIDAVGGSNGATSGGYLSHGESEFVVRGRGYLRSPRDIENTVVRAQNGTPVLVRNVAKVVEAYTPRRGAVARAEAIDSVEGTILLRRGENPKDVLNGVHEAVERINKDMLPPGMKIVPFYDRTRLVDTTLHTVGHNMIEGVVLVSVVLWLFLRALSGSFAVALTMPLALLTAFVGLHFAGVPANLLSMGAVDFGILLDGAVILVENAYRHLAEEQPPPQYVPDVVARAAKEVVRPTLFSMSIIAAAMMPIFTLERVEGRIFRPVALTYAFALGGALFFTMTTVPALTTVLLKNRKVEETEPGFLIWLRTRYLTALRAVLRHPWAPPLVGIALLVGAGSVLGKLGAEFLPQMNEGDIHITVTMPSSVSLQRGSEVLRDTRLDLLKFPEVKDVLTEQGHPEDGTDDEAANQAETFVIMKPEAEWHTGRSKEQIIDAMRAVLERRPGVVYNFSQPIKDRVEESISGIRGQIVVKIYGDDLNLMHDKLEEVDRVLTSVRGGRDIEIYRAGSAQHVVADVDREATSRYGVPVRDVEDAIETSYGGRVATSMWEGERRVDVRVKLPVPGEGDVASIGRLDVPVDAKTRLPLASLAKIHVDRGRTQINREQGGRFLAIKCNIEGRDMGSFVDEAQARVKKEVKLPEGYYMTWGGEFENQRRAMKRLSVIVPISILAIFALLYMTFQAILPAFVVLSVVPFATVGGVFALYLTHTPLSVSAAVGFITLFGVAVMDGVLLITYVRQARERTPDSEEAILDAVAQRLRPVLMTALLASLGLLPAAMSHAIGSDTQRPFAIVIIGGLISSTLLTMLLLPTLYKLVEGWFGGGLKWRRLHRRVTR